MRGSIPEDFFDLRCEFKVLHFAYCWLNLNYVCISIDYTSEQLVLLSLPTNARKAAVKLRWYQSWYSGYRQDVWSLDDVLIGAVDTSHFDQPVKGYVDDFNAGVYRYVNMELCTISYLTLCEHQRVVFFCGIQSSEGVFKYHHVGL